MNTKELLEFALEQKGYDGLCDTGWCSCELGDLAPCGEYVLDCSPAYKHSDSVLRPEPEECDGGCRL